LAATLANGAARDAHATDTDPSQPDARTLLAASGVAPDRLDHYTQVLDRLAQSVRTTYDAGDDARRRARAIHAFLHERVLRGKYQASASDIGAALDGGPFNCAAASALFLSLAARCGLDAHPVSVRGHVWCRVNDAGNSFDVETTCPGWFEIADRYAGVPTRDVSAVMAEHRSRSAAGRVLSPPEFLAIFYYNRGVTLLRQHQFAAAAEANRRALALDPNCRPAAENLAAAESGL
jgi:tetratricopeptide (TPR) repeat protein